MAIAREFDLVIIEDAAYEFMAPDAPVAMAKLAPERTFYDRGSVVSAMRRGRGRAFLVAPEKFVGGNVDGDQECRDRGFVWFMRGRLRR